jgi:hypothetical protein
MKTRFFLILLVLAVFTSCNTQWYVVDDKASTELKYSALPYYLPKTQIHVQVEYEQFHFIPGPYAHFAEEMLSIRGVTEQEKRYWKVSSIEMEQRSLPDRSQRYWIVPDGATPSVSLHKSGILNGINCAPHEPEGTGDASQFYPSEHENPADIPFTDLQIDKNTREVIDTSYRTVRRDSVVQRIPVYNTREVGKDLRHKAQDAADFIIRIRKNRFSLEAALEDQKVNGVDIAYMINKLEELEQSYLELFTGKLNTTTMTKHYVVTPGNHHQNETHFLDRLGAQVPVTLQEDMDGKILALTIEPMVAFEKSLESNDEKEKQSALIYRRPLPVQYIIKLDGQKLYQGEGLCPQMGSVMKLPVSLIDDNSSIRLNSKTGDIHSIKHIE